MAVILAITILGTGLIGSYTTVPAAEFSAGAIAAGETLEWITAALAGAGISISVKELLKPRQAEIEKDIGKHIDWDNYDWGDALDSPAAQDQIDELDKTINRLYGNASAKWKEMYEKSLSPTPTPESSPDQPQPSPPVTVAPVDPDTVMPPDWETLRKMSMKNGYLLLGTATYWCLKEAIKNWWDSIMQSEPDTTYKKNPFSYDDLIGYMELRQHDGSFYSISKDWLYYSGPLSDVTFNLDIRDKSYILSDNTRNKYFNDYLFEIRSWTNPFISVTCNQDTTGLSANDTIDYRFYHLYVPYTLNGVTHNAEIKPMSKSGIWVNPDLKNDHDKNKSPSIPATAPAPAIKIPSLDEIKDLQKKGYDSDDEKRPSIIQEFVTNHYTNPTPAPEPTTAPDPDPKPTTAPNPDPDPDPKPTTAPKPDDENTDVNPDDYKADLRLVFPFCIPFDLVHLIQAFETEPEAPVFEFPFDLELENPWTGKKILDYHHVFKLDMSDYEPVIKIFRIFEIIFFIIGLLMITRQQMIKG